MTELKELEQEYLAKQKQATDILYNHTAPQFSVDHDLTEYNQMRENKYADKGIMAEAPTMQEYAEPVPVLDRYATTTATVAEPTVKPTEFQSYIIPTAPAPVRPIPARPTPKAPTPIFDFVEKPVDFAENKTDKTDENDEIADENIEYVFKLRPPLVIAVACIAMVFLLLSVLFVVNTVNIAKANVELRQLQNEQIIADQELSAAQAAANYAKAQAIAEIEGNYATEYTVLPQGHLPTNYDKYREPVDLKSSTNTFDAICEFLSKIF